MAQSSTRHRALGSISGNKINQAINLRCRVFLLTPITSSPCRARGHIGCPLLPHISQGHPPVIYIKWKGGNSSPQKLVIFKILYIFLSIHADIACSIIVQIIYPITWWHFLTGTPLHFLVNPRYPCFTSLHDLT